MHYAFLAFLMMHFLQLWTCSNECLTSLVTLVLLEILDEAGSQILSLLVPLSSVSVSVARIEDVGIYALELCGNLEVEVRNLLGRSLQDSTTQDSVDDSR